MRGWRTHALLALVLPLADCSLMGLDAFDLPHCASNRDCDALNAERSIASDACQRYQCVQPERQCRLTARDQDGDGDAPVMCGGSDCDDNNARRNGARAPRPLAETCDGLDNNCNDVVDEGVWLGAPVMVGSVPAPVASASSATRADGRTAICTTTMAAVPSFSLLDGQHLDTGVLHYEARIPGDGAMQQVVDRCPILAAPGAYSLGSCNAVEAVAAPLDAGRWFVATLNTSGCARGQVRVGWMAESDRHLVLDAVGSPVAAGIDVSASESCTGASRVGDVRGAASLAITSIPAQGTTPPRALVTWLAVDRDANACGGDVRTIEGIVVTLGSHPVTGGARVDAVVAVGEGRPFAIGTTRARGPTGLVALPGDGRFDVGFGNADGQAVLRSVNATSGMPEAGAGTVMDAAMSEARDVLLAVSADVSRLAIASVTGCAGRGVSIAEAERAGRAWGMTERRWETTTRSYGSGCVSTASDDWVIGVVPAASNDTAVFARIGSLGYVNIIRSTQAVDSRYFCLPNRFVSSKMGAIFVEATRCQPPA